MGVVITKREYKNPYKGTTGIDWMIGNVGDYQELILDVSFAAFKRFELTDSLTISDPNRLILNGGEKWKELGFFNGLAFSLRYDFFDIATGSSTPNHLQPRVGLINDSEMICTNGNGTPLGGWGYAYGQIAPVTQATSEIRNVSVSANVQPQGVEVQYAHIINSIVESGSLSSHIDGTKTVVLAESTDDIALYPFGTPVDFTHQLDFKSGLSLLRATIEYRGSTIGNVFEYKYQIKFIYMISPFFDTVNNFVDMVAPDAVLGAEALTDNFLITGMPIYGNPNLTIKNDPKETEQEGNTGWFDENFNQLPNPYTHTDVVYKNLNGTTVGELDYVNPIEITTTISGFGTLSASTKVQYGFVWVPLVEEIWKKNDKQDHLNLKLSSGAQGTGLPASYPLSPIANVPFPLFNKGYSIDNSSGMNVSDVFFTKVGNEIKVKMIFRPDAGFAAYMETLGENERNYAIWISIGDPIPDYNESDRVSLLLDFRQMKTFIEPIGAYDGLTIDFLTHPQAATDTPIVSNDIRTEDDLLARVSFQVDTAIGVDIPVVTGINFGVLIENNTTGQQYILDKAEVDLSSFPDATQYNFDEPRSFKLGAGNSKNFFKVSYNAAADSGTLKGAKGEYGFKARWEDWLERFPHAANAFYDNTLGNNGFSENWYDYFNTTDYSLYFFAEIKAVLDGTLVLYQNLKVMPIFDYDVNATITTAFNYFKDDAGGAVQGSPLTGSVVFEDEFTWLDIVYTSTGTPWADQAYVDNNAWAKQCIDELNGNQLSLRQLSSIWASENDNPMVGIPTVALSTITWNATNQITVSTRIESNKLINSPSYKITGRLGCL